MKEALNPNLSGVKRRLVTNSQISRSSLPNNHPPFLHDGSNPPVRQSSLDRIEHQIQQGQVSLEQFSGSSSFNRGLLRPLSMTQSSLNGVEEQIQHGQKSLKQFCGSSNFNRGSLRPSLMTQSSFEGVEEEEEDDIGDLRRKSAAITVMCAAQATSVLLSLFLSRIDRSIPVPSSYARHGWLTRLTSDTLDNCKSQLRMTRRAFDRLVQLLRDRGYLKDTWYTSVEEQVAMFLYLIGQNSRNRNIKFLFYRSGETISRHFHQVLRAIISMHDIFLVQPVGLVCPPEIYDNSKFFPYFKDCVGALDGTHFRVKVPCDIVKRYRGRKEFPTQNVLAACSFNLKFTYVLADWEGSASDSRILNNALTREIDNLVVPRGKYYLVDAGYQLKTGFLTPYRSTRYHLKEWSGSRPQNSRELFNLRHASLRNAVERIFGILKNRFPILGSGTKPFYNVETQDDLVIAECILHNYLMDIDPSEDLIAEVDAELNARDVIDDAPTEFQGSRVSNLTEECREGEILRETIAASMWTEYSLRH